MKRIIGWLCLFLVTIFIFAGCKGNKPAERVTSITITPSKFLENIEPITYAETDVMSIETIMHFINSGLEKDEMINHISNGDLLFNVTINRETVKIFSIDFDMTLQEAYMTVAEKTYLIDSEATKAFVTAPNFKHYFNLSFNTPQIKLSIDQLSRDFYFQHDFEYNYFNQSRLTFSDTYNTESVDSKLILPVAITPSSPLQIAFDQQPDLIIQNIYSSDALISSSEVKDGKLLTPSEEGDYKIELSCTWKASEGRNYFGNTTCFFSVSIDTPISFLLNQTSAYPGDTFAIFVSGSNEGETFTVNAPFYDKTIQFYPYEKGYVGFIPIYAWLTPATYQIEAITNGTGIVKTFDVEVLPKAFDVQYLVVDQSTAAIYTDDNVAKDQVHFDRSKSNPTQEKLWEGAFIQPVDGVVTTDYCSTRYTNNNPNPSRHLAIDIANAVGTPIVASNNGKVALAMELITTGNTVVIDHGMGIFTSSFHMNEILVNEGDFVSKGDVIGKMGSTGYSTGSHLHFGVWKEGTFLNPWTLFSKDPLGFDIELKNINKTTVDNKATQTTKDFSSWDENRVYNFLSSVNDYTQLAYTKSFKTTDEAVLYYERYFSKELSKEIVEFLFLETNKGLKLIEGIDGHYLFYVYQDDEFNQINMTFNKEYINFKATYQIGLYSLVEYVIENPENPVITKWVTQ